MMLKCLITRVLNQNSGHLPCLQCLWGSASGVITYEVLGFSRVSAPELLQARVYFRLWG